MPGFFADQRRPQMPETLEEINEGKVPRDKYDRPLIRQANGDLEPYNRASSYGGQIENKDAVEEWTRRQVVRGIALQPDLLKAVPAGALADLWKDLEKSEKKALSRVSDRAQEIAGSNLKSELGTQIHAATEFVDRGDDLEWNLREFPPERRALLIERANAYYKTTREFGLVHDSIETFGVQDELRVAGTWDRRSFVPWWPEHRQTIVDVKGLALDTPLPTPTGWTTMGDVRVGDMVLGADGKPVEVTLKSATKRIGTYVVRLDDGEEIVCDSEHIWWTERSLAGKGVPQARSIEEVASTLRSPRGQAWHRVPVAEPLVLPEADLPIEPYLLGAWLGDGSKRDGRITKDRELFDVLEARGHKIGPRHLDPRTSGVVSSTVRGLVHDLRKTGLLLNKHIPAKYLRSSIEQRTALLQGLLDTDGGWNVARGREVFTTMDEGFARQVEELLLSLGQKPYVAQVKRHGFGKDVLAWTVEFLPRDITPHLHPRKAAAVLSGRSGQPVSPTRASRRLIVSVEPGPDVETACIAVDSDSHLYLAGRRMVPTHNTSSSLDFAGIGFAVQLATYAHMCAYDVETGTRTPHDDMNERWALIVHVDRNLGGHVEMARVDIARGWEQSRLAREIILARREKGLVEPIQEIEAAILTATSKAELVELIGNGRGWASYLLTIARQRWEQLP